jgi:hypothetical protein
MGIANLRLRPPEFFRRLAAATSAGQNFGFGSALPEQNTLLNISLLRVIFTASKLMIKNAPKRAASLSSSRSLPQALPRLLTTVQDLPLASLNPVGIC